MFFRTDSINLNPISFKVSLFLEDTLVQEQEIEIPEMMATAQANQIISQVAQDPRAMRVKFSREEEIWDQFENQKKILPLSIDFFNNAYVALFPEKFKENVDN